MLGSSDYIIFHCDKNSFCIFLEYTKRNTEKIQENFIYFFIQKEKSNIIDNQNLSKANKKLKKIIILNKYLIK